MGNLTVPFNISYGSNSFLDFAIPLAVWLLYFQDILRYIHQYSLGKVRSFSPYISQAKKPSNEPAEKVRL